MRIPFISGSDGFSADLPAGHKPSIPASPATSKNPVLYSATSRCDHCGTSDQLSGRPGSRVEGTVTCRSCKSVNVINAGRGYNFECRN